MRLPVLVAVVGALLCGAAWAMSSPTGSSPDEQYHLASIWCARGEDAPPCVKTGETADGRPVVTVPMIIASPQCYAGNVAISGECQKGIDPNATIPTEVVNSGQYPETYYRVMSVFLGDDVAASVLVMRLFNVLMAVVLFTLLVLSGTRATRRLQVYALTCLLVPLGWFMIASVNPSGWAIVGVTTFGFALHSFLVVEKGRPQTANGVLAVIGTMVAVSARGDAAVYIVLVAGVLAVMHWRRLLSRLRLGLLPVLCVLLSAYQVLTAGQVASTVGAAAITDRRLREVVASIAQDLPVIYSGMFGEGFGLGWLDTGVPYITKVTILGIVGFLLFSGLSRGGRAKWLAVLLLGSAMVVMPSLTLYRLRMIPGEFVQPRYLLPLVPVFMMMVLTGPGPRRGVRLAPRQAWIIWIGLSLANAAALYTNIRRYVTGLEETLVLGHHEWWWWSGQPGPITIWLVGSTGFAMFAWSIVVVSRSPGSARGVRQAARSLVAKPSGGSLRSRTHW